MSARSACSSIQDLGHRERNLCLEPTIALFSCQIEGPLLERERLARTTKVAEHHAELHRDPRDRRHDTGALRICERVTERALGLFVPPELAADVGRVRPSRSRPAHMARTIEMVRGAGDVLEHAHEVPVRLRTHHPRELDARSEQRIADVRRGFRQDGEQGVGDRPRR
jgi:hypothetical protein